MKTFSSRSLLYLSALCVMSLPMIGSAQIGAHGAHEVRSPASAASVATTPTVGEVRRIDLANQKITLRHEEITQLQMPSMTMVFKVNDPSLLQNLAVGDVVRFVAEKKGGEYWVIELQRKP